MYQDSGALFAGTLQTAEKSFYAKVAKAAFKVGYTKFVDPCSGALTVSCIAADAGFTDIEASDVTMLSGIVGRYVESRPIDDMGITDGVCELTDPLEALYEIKRLMLEASAGSEYGDAMLRDYESRHCEIVESLREKLDGLKERIPSFSYRDMDMLAHLREVLDNPEALVFINLPDSKGIYGRSYQAVSKALNWKEPPHTIFDPETGYSTLLDLVADAKCLVLFSQEAESGQCVGKPVFARRSSKVGFCSYIVSNRPEEVERIVGKGCSVRNPLSMKPLENPILPADHSITRKSKLSVVKAKPENIRYYRKLFTRNFVPNQLSSGYVMLIDGYVAGVFGYITMANDMGADCDSAFIRYAIATNSMHRVSKLLHQVACQRSSITMELTDVQMETIKTVKTAMLSRYPQSNELRGVMKLVSRQKDPSGYKLIYEADVKDQTPKAIMSEFASKEESWLKKK